MRGGESQDLQQAPAQMIAGPLRQSEKASFNYGLHLSARRMSNHELALRMKIVSTCSSLSWNPKLQRKP